MQAFCKHSSVSMENPFSDLFNSMASFLQLVSVVVYVLGAPAFTILALSYLHRRRSSSLLFRVFTVICALEFLNNVASSAIAIHSPLIALLSSLIVSLLPPMMAHLVLQQEPGPGGRSVWSVILGLLYLAAVLGALGGQGIMIAGFENSSQVILGFSAVFALILLAFSRRERSRPDRRQRGWNLFLFFILLLSAVAESLSENPFYNLLPDYILLLFFTIRLYYTERLAFFDTFVKQGTFFAFGAFCFGFLLLKMPPFARSFAADWRRTSLAILLLLPVWAIAPLLYSRVSGWTDRILHRKYSAIQAERRFMQAVQAETGEEQIKTAAVLSLEEIFDCHTIVSFEDDLPRVNVEDLAVPLVPDGYVLLKARENQIPFFSADRSLLETLTATLGVLRQNARLRAEQAGQLLREQQLAALASRAELRALRAQIDPHFLFNALNAIAGWIRTEPEYADDTVARLAEVFRYTLQRSQREWVEVAEEVEFISSYLAVEQARYRNRLEVKLEIDLAAGSFRIPAMMIQPLIENAIKHGTPEASLLRQVTLVIRREPRVLRISVTDNGAGFPAAFALGQHGSGHGLWNVSERLKGYYSDRGSLTWKHDSKGTCVTLAISIEGEL
jgi:signal transduction histidine kinase